MDRFCYLLLMFIFANTRCLFLAAFWSPFGKGLPLAFLYVMFSCVFVTFSFRVLGQVWHFIVVIPDLCFLSLTDFN